MFTVFWESVYPSASRLLYWSGPRHSEQQKRHLALSENFHSLTNYSCFSIVLLLGFKRKPYCPSFRSAYPQLVPTWTSYLYQVLSAHYYCGWQGSKCRPQCLKKFKLYCPQLRVIMDCTEIRCETASSLSLQSEIFSSYENHTTFKGLIGIAPYGVITFVSKLYTGSIKDIEITLQSHILQLL